MELYLDIEQYCDHSHHEDEEYGSWEERWTTSVGSMALPTNERGGMYVTYDGKLNDGDVIYAVVAVWGSGNSFGFAHGRYAEIICINKDIELANKNAAILDDEKQDPIITLDNGKTFTQYRPWTGYFENLDDIEVHAFTFHTTTPYRSNRRGY